MLLLVIKRFAIFAILFGITAGYSNYYAIDRPVARIRRPRPLGPGRPSPGRPEINIRPPPQRRNNPPTYPGEKYSHGQSPQSPYWGAKRRPQNPSWSMPRTPVWSQQSFDHYCIGLNKNIPDGDHIYQHYIPTYFSKKN